MADDPNIHRDLGRLEAQVAALTRQLEAMQTQVREMHDAITSAKGGWRVLVGVGAVAASVGALVTKLLGVLSR